MFPACKNRSHSTREFIEKRAALFAKVRGFFAERSVVEVDCPILGRYASVDTHIDLMQEESSGYFLHSSPEYGMKRLLAEGVGDCYQLSHVFRRGEEGLLHNPEFTMLEWYRLHVTLDQLIEETLSLLFSCLGKAPVRRFSYYDLFSHYLSLDSLTATQEQIFACLEGLGLAEGWSVGEESEVLLEYLLSSHIEAQFPRDEFIVVHPFPPSKAALSCVGERGGEQVAFRFEIYFAGVELANGYEELRDASEHRRRFARENQKREELGKQQYPVDEYFLHALEKGIPPCCGVSVGFDRLFQILLKGDSLSEAIPFSWKEA